MQIIQLAYIDLETTKRIIDIWEASVRATHEFLEEDDINSLKAVVEKILPELEKVLCIKDNEGNVQAFAGINGKKLEMLFVSPEFRGLGLGEKLTDYSVKKLKVKLVDVNEQNTQAVGFYEHMGFTVFERSDFDGYGNPFPILHMQLP